MKIEAFESSIDLWNSRGYHCENVDFENKRAVMLKRLSFIEMLRTGKSRDRILISFDKTIKVEQL